MKISIGQTNPRNVMRKAGYKPWRNPTTGGESYIRRTGASFYPRFHVLLKYGSDYSVILDLHFDARRPMHKKGVRCYEDEESAVVQEEAQRIQSFI
ncbi:hypothetical protein KKH43_06220 [Patescibacteria group bacterium]|nr:hypothetical protein [Patescibacteria group bacterium]